MEGRTPIWAYALGLFGGIAAMFAFVDAAAFTLYLAFAVLSAIFGAVWPVTSWRWSLWVTAPLVITVLIGVVFDGEVRVVDWLILIGVPIFAGAGGYAGAQVRARKSAGEVSAP